VVAFRERILVFVVILIFVIFVIVFVGILFVFIQILVVFVQDSFILLVFQLSFLFSLLGNSTDLILLCKGIVNGELTLSSAIVMTDPIVLARPFTGKLVKLRAIGPEVVGVGPEVFGSRCDSGGLLVTARGTGCSWGCGR
jgi:hypothetical protein